LDFAANASEVTSLWRYTNLFIIVIFTPVLNSQGMKKITLCNTKKYKNQAGMNLTPPPPIFKPTSTKPQAGKLG